MLSTLISWAALFAIAAGLTTYYNPDLLRKLRQSPPVQELKQPKKKIKRPHFKDGEEKGTSNPVSSNEAPISKKRKIVSAPVEDTVKVTTTKGQSTSIPRDEEGHMDNRAFAQQLARAQAGTKLEKSVGPVKEKRTVKPGKAFESPSLSTETSSTGGRDADDDMSPVGSPPSGTVSTAPTSGSGDVSDMLEAPAPKPTTLRLTDIPENKPKQNLKPLEQPMTKKQQQRKARREENRLQHDQAEKMRKELMEKQIRSARMAGGTSNQTKANTFAPTQNAWKKDPTPQPVAPATLLDTFDSNETPKANDVVSTAPLSNITNGSVNAAREDVVEKRLGALGEEGQDRPELSRQTSWADQVNEEEQSRWEKELVQEEQWEAVTSKKGKKKVKKDTDTSSEASSSLAKQNGANGAKTASLNRFQSMERLGGSDLDA